MSKCLHGFEKPSQCLDCMEEGVFDDPVKWERVGTGFLAKFDQACAAGSACVKDGTVHAFRESVQRWDKPGKTAYTHLMLCEPQ